MLRRDPTRSRTISQGPPASIPTSLGEEPDRLHGQVVVGLVEPVATGVGQHEHLGGTTPATGRGQTRFAGLEGALLDQLVEVAAYGGGGELEPLGEWGKLIADYRSTGLTLGRHPLEMLRPGQ